MRLTALLPFILFLAFAPANAAELPADPLQSVMWKDMAKKFFAGHDVVFDDRVAVTVPTVVENQAQVPVTADARKLANVEKLLVFADLNPIQHILTLTPGGAQPYIAFRLKVEQGTPVRAAALTSDGVWHVGGVFLEAAGGGCTASAMARSEDDWSVTVGNAQGRIWRLDDGLARMRLRVRHPMDTGLAKDGTPPFYIEKFEVKAPDGKGLATLEMFEPVSEDPTVTLLVKLPAAAAAVSVDGRDNNGTIYRSTIPAPWNQSQRRDSAAAAAQ